MTGPTEEKSQPGAVDRILALNVASIFSMLIGIILAAVSDSSVWLAAAGVLFRFAAVVLFLYAFGLLLALALRKLRGSSAET